MRNKITDLRNHLFATLESLRDEDKPMDLDRAQTIANVAQVVVNSAKVECHWLDLVGGTGTGFIFDSEEQKLPSHGSDQLKLVKR
jgi:uncharacterized damage-inducible protein DinB